MKKNISMLLLLFLCAMTYAAGVSKTINVATAGTLSSLITANEKTTITDLTVSGNIDARDFKCMRDEMTVLANVDLSRTIIKAYSGSSGTYFDGTYSYPANGMPNGAFSPKPMDGIPRGKKTLVTVKMPESITSIGSIAFANCSSLTGNLTIPNSVTLIEKAAFADCTGLNGTLTLPSELTTIETSAFHNCSALKGNLSIPSKVTTIGELAFMFCSGLDGTLTLTDAVTYIGEFAFSNCSGLTGRLNIPKHIVSIPDYTFEECNHFTEVVIPENCNSIGDNAFVNCSGVNKITVLNLNPPLIQPTTFQGINKATCNLTVQSGEALAYRNANYWNDFPVITEINLNTALPEAMAKITIKTNHQNKEITIDGLLQDKIVKLYDIMGKQISGSASNIGQAVFKTKYHGVYLLQINEETVKIYL